MGAAIGLREDFGSGQLRAQAKMVKAAGQARWLLALAVIYDKNNLIPRTALPSACAGQFLRHTSVCGQEMTGEGT